MFIISVPWSRSAPAGDRRSLKRERSIENRVEVLRGSKMYNLETNCYKSRLLRCIFFLIHFRVFHRYLCYPVQRIRYLLWFRAHANILKARYFKSWRDLDLNHASSIGRGSSPCHTAWCIHTHILNLVQPTPYSCRVYYSRVICTSLLEVIMNGCSLPDYSCSYSVP